jgi:hypothetical protein
MNKKLQSSGREQVFVFVVPANLAEDCHTDIPAPSEEEKAPNGLTDQLSEDNPLERRAESRASERQLELQFLEEKQLVVHNGETFLVQSSSQLTGFSPTSGSVFR